MVKLQDAYAWNKNLFIVENNPAKIVGKFFPEDNNTKVEKTVSIIGVEQVLRKDLPFARRALWIVSLILCCSLVAYYVTSRVIYIVSLPTQVAVTLQQNDSLVLPDVTICPSPIFSPDNLIKLGMTADGLIQNASSSQEINIRKLWQEMAYSKDFIAVTLVNLENSRPNWRFVFTTMGVCLRHHYDGRIQASGMNFGLQLKIDWAKFLPPQSGIVRNEGLKIFFHSAQEEAVTEIDGIFISPGEDISIAVRLKEFQSLNRTANPCIYSDSYAKSICVNGCFNSELFGALGCNLPFMATATTTGAGGAAAATTETSTTTAGETSKKNTQSGYQSEEMTSKGFNSSDCQTVPAYNAGMREFNRQRFNVTLWAGCGQGCLIECNKIVYTPFVESVAPSLRNISKLVLYFPEMSYEIVKEKEAYDLIALLCDIGGTFGLFLGCSILTLVELFELICMFLFRRQ